MPRIVQKKQHPSHATPLRIRGQLFEDARGYLTAINGFSFQKIKRFYQIQNRSTRTIRAFHGHWKEEKYMFVAQGSAHFCLVPLTNFQNPSRKSTVAQYTLSADKPTILHIPARYAHGFHMLLPKTIVIVFSTSTLLQSKKDDKRYAWDYWGKTIWKKSRVSK